MIFVISAPSGTGKTTVLKILREKYRLTRLLTYTTRPVRQGERDRKDYLFCTEEKFRKLITSNGLAEWAVVYGYHYGTPRKVLEETLKKGKSAILALDTQGAARIKSEYPELAVLIALLPPSYQELESRIRHRQKETGEDESAIERRLSEVQKEMQILSRYDYQIINTRPEEAADSLYQIIQKYLIQPDVILSKTKNL
ncbi:MAG: guanylate kinase [Candidatus Omnitrophota bacterium]